MFKENIKQLENVLMVRVLLVMIHEENVIVQKSQQDGKLMKNITFSELYKRWYDYFIDTQELFGYRIKLAYSY